MRRLAIWPLILLLMIILAACGDGPAPIASDQGVIAVDVTPTRPGWSGDLTVPTPPLQAGTPLEATTSFYRWYLGFATSGDPAQDPVQNRIYAQSGYLTSDLIEAVDRFLIGLDEQGFPTIDPLLCSISPPSEFTIDGRVDNGDTTLVLVRTDLPRHGFTVHLRPKGTTWQIADITCAAAPDGVATAFYVWYLGQETPPANPSSDYLSLALIEKARQQLAGSGLDPFTLASEPPTAFRVEPEDAADSVILEEQLGDGSVQRLRLRFVQAGSDWLIDDVSLVSP